MHLDIANRLRLGTISRGAWTLGTNLFLEGFVFLSTKFYILQPILHTSTNYSFEVKRTLRFVLSFR